ncbi:coiled-coil domain-containing protein 152-like isoform X2 [Brienomyrus brachyistius]|uniref:coiled-coil domain-containing protein 152-like isoform X2 n=1 Tax=Brienomyrus brachyistius TaxID=42636 RepID=UPI0020B30174|nr:coiled-coil domain-containing protein 152-like isoform X2 [Brienomyrus brachyistius]
MEVLGPSVTICQRGNQVLTHLIGREMQGRGAVNLQRLLDDFTHIEETITEVTKRNSFLEVKLEETSQLIKLSKTKEKYLKEGENESLRNTILLMEREFQARIEEGKACEAKLAKDLRDLEDRHQEGLEEMRREMRHSVEMKGLEMKALAELKDSELEEMRQKIKEQERERQSELLKLQMEFSARMARVQASFQGQKQLQVTPPVSRSVFQRKLQSLQEEKSREVAALHQQVAALQQQLFKQTHQSKRKKL